MRSRLRFRRPSSASALGVVVGVVAGIAFATWSTAFAGPSTVQAPAIFDVTHLPPLLTVAGEPIDLAYDVHCAPSDLENADAGCDARGTVSVRELGDTGPFRSG